MLTIKSDYENTHLNNHVMPFHIHPTGEHEEKSDNTRLWQDCGEMVTFKGQW